MVSERGLQVLRAIVEDYVETNEPVGSRSIVERHAFGVSAATIRNDMAQLEVEDLIAAPALNYAAEFLRGWRSRIELTSLPTSL